MNTINPVWVVNFSQFLKKKKRKEEKFKISKIFRLVSTCCLIMREVSCDFGWLIIAAILWRSWFSEINNLVFPEICQRSKKKAPYCIRGDFLYIEPPFFGNDQHNRIINAFASGLDINSGKTWLRKLQKHKW